MDCGLQRVWFDPNAEGFSYADMAVSESVAEKMCRDEIINSTLSRPNFHYFSKSYTIHDPIKSVTFEQGFDVENAFGLKLKYLAVCLIQPNKNLEINIQQN